MSSSSARLDELAADPVALAINFPEFLQKRIGKFLIGDSLLGREGQNLLIVSSVLVAAGCFYLNRGVESRFRPGGGDQLAAFYALLLLGVMANGDGFGETIFSKDGDTSEQMRMMVMYPAAIYVAATVYCRRTGRCDGAALQRALQSAVPLLSSAFLVGSLNAILGGMVSQSLGEYLQVAGIPLYYQEGDERERDQYTAEGIFARLSDAVSTTPGVLATMYVYSATRGDIGSLFGGSTGSITGGGYGHGYGHKKMMKGGSTSAFRGGSNFDFGRYSSVAGGMRIQGGMSA